MTTPIVSVHYHLRPGGVTSVIKATDRILEEAGVPHQVLSGNSPGLEAFDYDESASGDLSAQLRKAAGAHFGDESLLWHFHNPCLGRNPALTRSLVQLARDGEAMVLQHHDLAEDGRPRNLAILDEVEVPYPDAPRIAHAFLNRRDRDVFLAAGLDPDRAVLLPNPIQHFPRRDPVPEGPARVLLPMRGLPRKNLGEFLLLAAAAPEGVEFLQGSAPTQPRWQPAYDAWRSFAEAEPLPVRFDVFAEHSPAWWFRHSTHLLTTSRQEGFGLVHIEAANHRRVLGRRLPHLKLEGFPEDGLYDALGVGGQDFAQLSDEEQREVILQFQRREIVVTVMNNGEASPLRTWLRLQLDDRTPCDASAGLDHHSDTAHLRRLRGLADRLLKAPQGPVRALDRQSIVAAFR